MVATRAIVRAPGRTYPEALAQREPRPVVDLELARRQHRGYVATLRHVGLEVTELPADDEHPDAVFVQDRGLRPRRAGDREAARGCVATRRGPGARRGMLGRF